MAEQLLRDVTQAELLYATNWSKVVAIVQAEFCDGNLTNKSMW